MSHQSLKDTWSPQCKLSSENRGPLVKNRLLFIFIVYLFMTQLFISATHKAWELSTVLNKLLATKYITEFMHKRSQALENINTNHTPNFSQKYKKRYFKTTERIF